MFILRLPTAVEWEKFAYDNELKSENIRELLLEALCSDVATVPSPFESTLAEFGCALLERSRCLLAKNMRAAKLAKLFGCAIMCIVEHLDGGLKQSAGDLNRKMASAINEVPAIQKRSRNFKHWLVLFPCLGREILSQIFSITNPAAAAEISCVLSMDKYRMILPAAKSSLDVLAVIKLLLRGTIEDRVICYALGYSDQSLTSCLPPSRDPSRNWLIEALERTTDQQPASTISPEEQLGVTSSATSMFEDPDATRITISPEDPGRSQDYEENEFTDIMVEDKSQQTDTGLRFEYTWDPGPIDLLPYSFEEWTYDSDRGPYNPRTFNLDELDKEFETFTAGQSL
ncbi:hypothetical protein ASPCAL00763 [Aspergillus calidoustus]|uniref:Uncharacterized protein n=1 Tax=Aspergillus calidoustus TaxID=454130 RepID=A0A0U5FPR1_ASPCI|nr:hypothetical protein ASPCAL00763 [Aspergillus calidoustus]